MAKKFLTHIDLTGNELRNSHLINAVLETAASDPATDLSEGRIYYNTTSQAIKVYDGTAWVGIGEIVSISNTDLNLDVSIVDGVATINLASTIDANTTGNAATATKLETSRTISLSGDVTGSASFDGSANATITATISANSVALGTDTTGDYVAGVSGTDGVSVTGTGEGASVTIANTDKGSSQNIFKNVSDGTTTIVADNNDDTLTVSAGTGIGVSANSTTDTLTISNTGVTSISGTTNEVTVDTSTGSVTIGLPDSVQITTDLTVGGNLTVNGTTTTLNTTELLVEDNIITLNSGVTGTPVLNAGIEVERGDSPNVIIRWNESTDTWELTRDGTNYEEITTVGTITASDISDFTEAAQDAVGGIVVNTGLVPITYSDSTPSISADITLATTSYLSKTGGALTVDIAAVKTELISSSFTKKYSANVPSQTNPSFPHGLGMDVIVNVYSNSTGETVETDVIRTSANGGTVTLGFASAPVADAYKVVIIG